MRQQVGMFDISHMGVLRLEGTNPKDTLQALVPTDLTRIGPGEACYTVLLNETGGILDDLVVYDLGTNKQDSQSLLIVINAACSKTDTIWLKQHLQPAGIALSDAKNNGVLLALQGPQATKVLERLSGESLASLPRFGHRQVLFYGLGAKDPSSIFVARTGYTGEAGFELLLEAEAGRALWLKLLAEGVIPCGLGSRDTLRLEAAMHLYGQDMDLTLIHI